MREGRIVSRSAPQTSHQSEGFVETVHGHVLGLAPCYQTQIATNTGLQLSATSPTIPFAVRCAGCVLTRFTMRPDGRTPFQYLLGAPNVSAMCVVGQSLCALILDHTILRYERQGPQRSEVVAGSPGSVGELSAPGHPSRRL